MKFTFKIFSTRPKTREQMTKELARILDTANVAIPKVMEVLREGADPDLYLNGLTALHRAALGKLASLDAVNVLLDSGANPFLPVIYGRKQYRLSTLIKERPDVLDRIRRAEMAYEHTHGPQPLPISFCSLRLPKRPVN